jgi:hypothetical protein
MRRVASHQLCSCDRIIIDLSRKYGIEPGFLGFSGDRPDLIGPPSRTRNKSKS